MPDELANKLDKILKLKQEHRELLQKIVADSGMSLDVRLELINHLLDEEDEHLQEIVASNAQPSSLTAQAWDRPGLTVGSMRREAVALRAARAIKV